MDTNTPPTAAELIMAATVLSEFMSKSAAFTTCAHILARHVLATVQANDDAPLTPEVLRAMGAQGGPREFWFKLPVGNGNALGATIDVDFSHAEKWEVWANDHKYSEVVLLAIDPTVGQLRTLLRGLGITTTTKTGE